jgi:hypothetical protein
MVTRTRHFNSNVRVICVIRITGIVPALSAPVFIAPMSLAPMSRRRTR